MTARTKLLALGALLVFGLYFADSAYRSWIEEPRAQLETRCDSLLRDIRETEDQQKLSQRVGKRMDPYAARALPYDPDLARSRYQEWLLQLVESHELESPSVDAAQPIAIQIRAGRNRRERKTVGHRIGFSLRAQCTLAHLTDFLFDFRQAGHLHKIRSLALTPLSVQGKLDMSLTIEALSLTAAPSKDQLSEWEMIPGEHDSLQSFAPVVQRNLFAHGFAKALFDIQLKAITRNRDGQSEAWFQLDSRGKIETLTAGRQLPVPLYDISIVEVHADRVLVHVNQSPFWLTLGQSIGEVCGGKPES